MKEPKELEFEFEEILLSDAELFVAAGSGRSAEILLMLSKKLPQMEQENQGVAYEQRKSFAFSLPNGALDRKDIKSICHKANAGMTKLGLNWLLRYVEREKKFVCVMKTIKTRINKMGRHNERQGNEDVRIQCQALYDKGAGYGVISKQLGVSVTTVRHYLSRTNKKRSLSELGSKISAEQLVDLARWTLSFNLPLNGHNKETEEFKVVVARVGLLNLAMRTADVDMALGYKKGGASYAKLHGQFNQSDVSALLLALNIKEAN